MMLTVISPAKSLDFESELPKLTTTHTRFDNQSQVLIDELKHYSPEDISKLMSVSEKIAELNFERFHNWCPPKQSRNARAAIFAFKGDVYTGFDAETATTATLDSAQSQLRILSGLYGLLRPLDEILPYRLEMGTKLQVNEANNLYQFWDDQITALLNQDMKDLGSKYLINLASNEYFKAVKLKQLKVPVITPVFKDTKNGKQKIISFYAKKARGVMARWVVETKPSSIEDLKAFNEAGYKFDPNQSDALSLVFTRPEIA
jgi:cytoplasmic iron level regulating protein YaaA (DUF328/UPF0246 family)